MENIILFDMDGTLTKPRQKIQIPVINKLIDILESGHHVGIVTGSPENYIDEQLSKFLSEIVSHYNHLAQRLHLLPCNGTKYIVFEDKHRKEVASNNMATNLPEGSFNSIMAALIQLQSTLTDLLLSSGLSLTGNFIQYRGSMINWCPVGRNANHEERAAFVEYDKLTNFRNDLKNVIEEWFEENKLSNELTVALGGSTSFDIYPTGWDKTYALKRFPEKLCWFVGDKCQPGGNDQHLYDELKPMGRSFETKNPTETIEIIEGILNTLSSDSSVG